jgi:hypothetical protein
MEDAMSTLTMRSTFALYGVPGSRRDPREQKAVEAMHHHGARSLLIGAGTITVALFSLLAPMTGNPANKLWSLDARATLPFEGNIATVRPFEMRPTMMGPAITPDVLMRAEAVQMPPLEVQAPAPADEVVTPPRG